MAPLAGLSTMGFPWARWYSWMHGEAGIHSVPSKDAMGSKEVGLSEDDVDGVLGNNVESSVGVLSCDPCVTDP